MRYPAPVSSAGRCRITPYVIKAAPLRRTAAPVPGSALATPARYGRAHATGHRAGQVRSLGRPHEQLGRLPRLRLSGSWRPRLGRPCGPSHTIGYADPRPGDLSPGVGACEEDEAEQETGPEEPERWSAYSLEAGSPCSAASS